MTRKIAFINEKGGSCKTTLSTNLAAYFAGYMNKKVLLVDMDPQGQAGKAFGVNVKEQSLTVMNLLTDSNVSPQDVIIPSRIENLDLLCANKTLTDFAVIAAADEDRVLRLKNSLGDTSKYDMIVFDSPPSLGLLTLNIMMATDEIVIPVSLTYFALDGCAEIIDTVETVKSNYGHTALRVSHIVPALYRRTRLADAILEKLHSFFEGKTTKTVIGLNVAIDEAQSYGQTIWEYAPSSRGAQMFEALAKEIA
jgi:chromosome partitioning protein